MKTQLSVLSVALSACMGNAQYKIEEPPAPAALSVVVSADPAQASVGQAVKLRVEVRNTGALAAAAVSTTAPLLSGAGHAMLEGAAQPTLPELAGGATHVFELTWRATDPGPLAFAIGAQGTDARSEASITAEPRSAQVLIQSPPMLEVAELELPAQATVGTDFPLVVRVLNGGQASASTVLPEVTLSGGGAAMVLAPAPAAADLGGGQSALFTFTYRPTTAGVVTFQATARGTDANSGASVSGPLASATPLEIDTPAALEATLSLPASLSTGQTFTATLVVRNTGTVTAQGVLPLPLAPTVTTLSGDASAATTQAPAALEIPGGGTASFTWQFTASGSGTFTLSGGARGVDARSGQPVQSQAATSATAQVLVPSALVVTAFSLPGQLTRGQTFTVSLTAQNAGAVALGNVLPDPLIPSLTATGGAQAATASTPAPLSLAPGQSGTFTWTYQENGTGIGSLAFTTGLKGTGPGGVVVGNPTSTNLALVRAPAALLVESITVPAKISQGQAFTAVVAVRNSGGTALTNVVPQLSVVPAGGANASTASSPPAVALAAGARATFSYAFTENGTDPGTLLLSATASGTDALTGAVTAPARTSPALLVEAPASLAITAFALPGTLARGQSFAVSMTVRNNGQAAANLVLPSPVRPIAAITGGVTVATTTTPAAVTVAGGTSQTFTWMYVENGTAAGTVSFTGSAAGADANSLAAVSAPAATTAVVSVSMATGCGGSALYTGFGGRALHGDRLDVLAQTNRLRIKPYPMLVTELARVLGLAAPPAYITGQTATFNAPLPRWSDEQQLGAVSMYQVLKASFQGCLAYTASPARPQFATLPTAATATTECAALQRRFWSRVPTAAETASCSGLATNPLINDTDPKRRWAYACAAVLSSSGFLSY